jgi:hypothetical protein
VGLILIVTVIVIVSLVILGVAGSWIDASIGRQEDTDDRRQNP